MSAGGSVPLRRLVRQPGFLITTTSAVAITAADVVTDKFVPGVPDMSTLLVMLFVLPVIYAALRFGLAGSLWTTGWCVALDVPVCIVDHSGWVRIIQLLHWVLLAGVSVFVAVQIDGQRRMREQAAQSDAAMRASERKYRSLFATNPVATVLVGAGGRVAEANPAACLLFDLPPAGLQGAALGGLLSPRDAGADLPLEGAEAVAVVAKRPETWVKILSTPANPEDGGQQVFLHEVTAQRQWRRNLRTYAAGVLRAQEEERRRIAGELHDDTIQTTIHLCRRLDALLPPAGTAPALEEAVRGARATAEGLIDGLHSIIRNLRPPALDDLGLVTALRQLARGFEGRTGVPVAFRAPGDSPRLAADKETSVYRIVQEALSNVERHAHAAHVTVDVVCSAHRLSVAVGDDGVGFAPGPRLPDEALGLAGMRERAELSGATLTIDSAPGRGTRVEIDCPF